MNSSQTRRRVLLSLLILISLWGFSGCHKQASVQDVPAGSETAFEDRIVVDDWLDVTPDAIYPVQALENRLAAGANVHEIDEDRSLTPLLAAALRGDEACFARLHQAGADPNQVLFQENEQKLTPIWEAVDRKNARAVRMLLNAGADVHTPRLFHDEPLIFWSRFILLGFVRNASVFTLNHIADVNLICEHIRNCKILPKCAVFSSRSLVT